MTAKRREAAAFPGGENRITYRYMPFGSLENPAPTFVEAFHTRAEKCPVADWNCGLAKSYFDTSLYQAVMAFANVGSAELNINRFSEYLPVLCRNKPCSAQSCAPEARSASQATSGHPWSFRLEFTLATTPVTFTLSMQVNMKNFPHSLATITSSAYSMERRALLDLCAERGVTRKSIEKLLNKYQPPDEHIRIRNLDHYINALTHRSTLKEFVCPKGSNERMELLGDSIINFIVTDMLYKRFPHQDEGFLTRVRTKLVRGSSLHDWAVKHNLEELILMNSKALEQNWNTNAKKLEDTFEAIVGALYLDIGMSGCKAFLLRIINDVVDFDEAVKDNNYKDILMRRMQMVHSEMVNSNINKTQYGTDIMPQYSVIDTFGEDHQKIFKVAVSIDGKVLGTGQATQKRQAEQHAAYQALCEMGAVP